MIPLNHGDTVVAVTLWDGLLMVFTSQGHIYRVARDRHSTRDLQVEKLS